MNIIDISSWQKGINLSTLFAENPLDGVVVKATEGTGYTNPEFKGWADYLVEHGKPLGLYHYLDTNDPEKQANHFYNTVKPYLGKAVLVADYEADALTKGTSFLKRFVDQIYHLCGVKCMIYCSISVVQSQVFSSLTSFPLWIAQYADMATVNGFLENPWQKGSVEPFDRYIMHQYTSRGLLKGWGGVKVSYDEDCNKQETVTGFLDLDKFDGSFAEWCELCRGNVSPSVPGKLKDADPVIVSEVLSGKYGIGNERAAKIKEAGYDPDKVQRKINELYAIALSCKKFVKGNENYLNSIDYIIKVL